MDGYVSCGVTAPLLQGPLLEKAIAELKSHDLSDKVSAVKDFYTASKALMADYQTCKEDTGDAATLAKIDAYMSQYPDRAALTKHIESDLFWNAIDIAKESADLALKLGQGDYLAVGTDAGLLMDKIIIGTNKFSETKTSDTAVKPLTPE